MRLLLFHQVLSEATEDNLIDLGPGSPAVVSNMANAAPAGIHHAAGGGPSSPATLASRLAGLGMQTSPNPTRAPLVLILYLTGVFGRTAFPGLRGSFSGVLLTSTCVSLPPDMGADSVSSTLSSLTSCKPPPSQDDFDVFAQTRTGALSAPPLNT